MGHIPLISPDICYFQLDKSSQFPRKAIAGCDSFVTENRNLLQLRKNFCAWKNCPEQPTRGRSLVQHILSFSFYRSWRKLIRGASTGWSCTGAPQRLLGQQRFNGSSWSWCKGIVSHWRQRFNQRWRSTIAEVRSHTCKPKAQNLGFGDSSS